MELRQYVAKVDLAKQTELGKVKLRQKAHLCLMKSLQFLEI